MVRVMNQKGDQSKRQLFLDKKENQQPVKLSNLSASSGTSFFNKGTVMEDADVHLLDFKCSATASAEAEVITVVSLNQCLSGIFTISGTIKWKEGVRLLESMNKKIRDATFTDITGSIQLSVWGEQIEKMQENRFYTITDVRLRYYYGKCLSTTRSSVITEADSQDISNAPSTIAEVSICCPTIMNVTVNVYPVCNSAGCNKKVIGNPGAPVVKCHNCNKKNIAKKLLL